MSRERAVTTDAGRSCRKLDNCGKSGSGLDDDDDDDDARSVGTGAKRGEKHTVRTRRLGRERVCRGRSR